MKKYDFGNNYFHVLDQKNRVFLPAEFRSQLGVEFIVCTPPGSKNCIIIYPMAEWDRYFEQLRTICTGNDLAMAERIANSRKKRTSPDKQGRITLPQEFCERAGLEKDVLIMGVGNRVEIWNPDTWQDTLQEYENATHEWKSMVML